MKELLQSTKVYRALRSDCLNGAQSQAALVIFPDGKYLRALLKECAKAFFGAEEGSREESLITKESFADCLFFPSADGKLTADDAARIIEESLLSPMERDKKLFVLDNFHGAAPLVQNKLLKLLEEPPANVYFLLGASAEFPVLSTVKSRVKKYEESPFSEAAVEAALKRNYPSEDVKRAAAACGGIYSAAEELLSGGGEAFRLAEEFLTTKNASEFCRKTGEYKEKRAFLRALMLLLRDMLFYKEGQGKYAALKSAERLADNYAAGALIASIGLVCEAEKQIQFNANFGQCLFMLALGMEKERKKWQKLS